jgi:hypothetical protein
MHARRGGGIEPTAQRRQVHCIRVYTHHTLYTHTIYAGKYTAFEGGIRGNAFVSGGFVPKAMRGTKSEHLMAIADWYFHIHHTPCYTSYTTYTMHHIPYIIHYTMHCRYSTFIIHSSYTVLYALILSMQVFHLHHTLTIHYALCTAGIPPSASSQGWIQRIILELPPACPPSTRSICGPFSLGLTIPPPALSFSSPNPHSLRVSGS